MGKVQDNYGIRVLEEKKKELRDLLDYGHNLPWQEITYITQIESIDSVLQKIEDYN